MHIKQKYQNIFVKLTFLVTVVLSIKVIVTTVGLVEVYWRSRKKTYGNGKLNANPIVSPLLTVTVEPSNISSAVMPIGVTTSNGLNSECNKPTGHTSSGDGDDSGFGVDEDGAMAKITKCKQIQFLWNVK